MSFTDEYEDEWIKIEPCNLCGKILYVEDLYEVYHKMPGVGVVCDDCMIEAESDFSKV